MRVRVLITFAKARAEEVKMPTVSSVRDLTQIN
jgi:hypothetical protein